MALDNSNPITTPAIPAKTFLHLWLSKIIISAPSINSGSAKIETIPFNGETGEIGSGDDMVAVETDDLWAAINEIPELKTAMGAIIACVKPLEAWVAEKEAERLAELETP